MNTHTTTTRNAQLVLGLALLLGSAVGNAFAQDATGRDGFRAEQQAQWEAHREQQKQENRELFQTLKGKTVAEICAALKTHLGTQHAENVAFHDAQYQRHVDHITQRADAGGGSNEQLRARLAALAARYAEAKAHVATQHQENVGQLDQLAADPELTPKTLHEAIRQHMAQQRAENEAFHATMRDARQERRTKRPAARDRNEAA